MIDYKKNALIKLLEFKVGITDQLYKEDYSLLDSSDFIIENDLTSGYITRHRDYYERESLKIDNDLLYRSSILGYLSTAVNNFIEYIDELRCRERNPLFDTTTEEALTVIDLLDIIFKMPALRTIYCSNNNYTYETYLCEISWEELDDPDINIQERVLVKADKSEVDSGWKSIERTKEIRDSGHYTRRTLKFYLETNFEYLGYCKSTFPYDDFRCNQIFLCQETISDEIKRLSYDKWNENNFWISVLYHELCHVIWGHGPCEKIIVNGDEYKVVNKKNEHEAQSYSSVLFSSKIASRHIYSYSIRQPIAYRNMPLWSYENHNITIDNGLFEEYLVDVYINKRGTHCTDNTAQSYKSAIITFLNKYNLSLLQLINNIYYYDYKYGRSIKNLSGALRALKAFEQWQSFM